MRLPGAKKQSFELSDGRIITIHEVRPFDIRMLYRSMTENLDGLSKKEVLDTVIERENMALFRLCERGIDEYLHEIIPVDAAKAFDLWHKINSEFFKSLEKTDETQKKYMRVETCREISYNTFCGVCKLVQAGHVNADFYGWCDFQEALKFCESLEKQRIHEFATAICCAFNEKTWEKVLK